MKRLAVLLLLAELSPAAMAASRVTVEQVEQVLISARDEKDAKVAARIAELELLERASAAWVQKWQKESPGEQTSKALVGLADEAAFLDLPSAEIPSIDKPDPEGRRQILLRAVEYVKTTIHRLPNFSALRSTTHFDNVSVAQQELEQYANDRANGFNSLPRPETPPASAPEPMHFRSSSSMLVTYRDGHEVMDSPAESGPRQKKDEIGLTTSGEFGPILTVVVGDALHGEVFWDHWEQGEKGPMAVFRYSVSKEMSHYTVLSRSGSKPETPAYHGEIGIDPATGTILRMTLVSLPASPSFVENSILVVYDAVTIGNVSYTLPVKGVAFCRTPSAPARADINPFTNVAGVVYMIPSQTFLNDVSFTHYRVFRADLRVLP